MQLLKIDKLTMLGGSSRSVIKKPSSNMLSPMESRFEDSTSRYMKQSDSSPSNSDNSNGKPQMINKKHIPWHLRVRLKNIVKASPKAQSDAKNSKKD